MVVVGATVVKTDVVVVAGKDVVVEVVDVLE